METFTPDTAKAYLELTIRDSLRYDIRHLASCVLLDPKFLVWPASKGHHHAFASGLLIHTAEVVRNCRHLMGTLPNVDASVVLMAALHHDRMKVREYDVIFGPVAKCCQVSLGAPYRDGDVCPNCNEPLALGDTLPIAILKTPFLSKVGHIYSSAESFHTMAKHTQTDPAYAEEVIHCILSHHGRNEWSSPVEPVTFEAWILHAADMMSSRP